MASASNAWRSRHRIAQIVAGEQQNDGVEEAVEEAS
jgi:hypothetical protein